MSEIMDQRAYAAYILLTKKKISRMELAKKLKINEGLVSDVITQIRKQGHIVRIETGSVYWLDDDALNRARFENRNLDGFV